MILYCVMEMPQKETLENVRTPLCFRILSLSLTSVSIFSVCCYSIVSISVVCPQSSKTVFMNMIKKSRLIESTFSRLSLF
jgi:hypothetical protein